MIRGRITRGGIILGLLWAVVLYEMVAFNGGGFAVGFTAGVLALYSTQRASDRLLRGPDIDNRPKRPYDQENEEEAQWS